MRNKPSNTINRRKFLHRAGAGAALFNILPGAFSGAAEKLSPNAKLNVAGIGIGSRGGADLADVAGLGHNIVAVQLPSLPKVDGHHDVPEPLDYALWLGPVQYRPYSPLWVPWHWRGWMPFGRGVIGDWICHVLDPAFWALDLGAPSSVHAEVA